MTTLIMVQKDGDVELGWDSQLTRSNEKHALVAPKIFVNGDLVFGVSGVCRAADVVETTEFPPFEGNDPRKWIIRVLTPVLRDALVKEPALLTEDGTMEGWGLFVVVSGQAFQFDNMFNAIQHVDGLYTMGSGGDYARGALSTGVSIDKALEVAASIDPYTGGPMTVCLASEYLAQDDEHVSAG